MFGGFLFGLLSFIPVLGLAVGAGLGPARRPGMHPVVLK